MNLSPNDYKKNNKIIYKYFKDKYGNKKRQLFEFRQKKRKKQEAIL